MTAVLLTLLLAGAPATDELIERADTLASLAKQLDAPEKDAAVERALEAYRAILDRYPKDRRLGPRIRRRCASLLRHAGRAREALKEYDAILEGRSRRKDKALALYDSAMLLHRESDPVEAEKRLRRALAKYRDVRSVRAKALLACGDICLETGRAGHARAAWRELVERCEDEEKQAIAAYDRLALQALDEGDTRRARRWLERCVACYGERAERGDRFGAFLSRQLGEMRAPVRLAETERRKEQDKQEQIPVRR